MKTQRAASHPQFNFFNLNISAHLMSMASAMVAWEKVKKLSKFIWLGA